jgi:hypothetical protein
VPQGYLAESAGVPHPRLDSAMRGAEGTAAAPMTEAEIWRFVNAIHPGSAAGDRDKAGLR